MFTRWIIAGEPGNIIRLSWLNFNLEESPGCAYDYLAVYDNTSIPNTGSLGPTLMLSEFNFGLSGGLMGQFCGNANPPDITTSENMMSIVFKSDHSVARDGFTASYVILNSSTACGGNYFTTSGVLRSPGYPDPYGHNR